MFAELIQAIPEIERWKSPFLQGAVNGWKSLKEAESKSVALSSFFKAPDPQKNEAELDRVELAAEERIPWPREQDWALMQRWMTANRDYSKSITEIIEQCDYISEFENQELCYYEDPFGQFEVQTLRQSMLFLKLRACCAMRAKQGDEVQKTLDLMRLMVQKMTGTKGYVLHAMTRSALISVVPDTAIKFLHQSQTTLQQGEHVWKFLVSLRKLQPTMKLEHQLEYQNYYPNILAQVPLLKNLRDQIPALDLAGHIEQAGADVVLQTPKEHIPDKSDDLIRAERMQDLTADSFGLSRALPLLKGHPQPFDKTQTVAWAWQAAQDFLTEYRRHEHPNLTMKWRPDKYFAELDRLYPEDKSHFDELFAALQRGDLNLPEKPPLTEDVVVELRRTFAKQQNPLGRLYVAAQLTGVAFITYNTSSRERQEASELCAACWLYEKRHQRRPKMLEELVTERLFERIPISAHTGEPFGYEAKRGLIWRRGENGTPDGRLPDEEIPAGMSIADINAFLGIYPLIPVG